MDGEIFGGRKQSALRRQVFITKHRRKKSRSGEIKMNSDFIVAVHALVFLHHKQETLSSEMIAENVCTNPVRVRRVMARLGKAGLVETRRGCAYGGYCYKKTGPVTLRQLADASGMTGYMDSLFTQLDALCKSRLEQITIAEIEKELFQNL